MMLPRSYQVGAEGGDGVRAPHSASTDPEGVRAQPLPCPTHDALAGLGVRVTAPHVAPLPPVGGETPDSLLNLL